jgi:hypothetical protein
MALSLRILAAASAALLLAPAAGAAPARCGESPYSYAGVLSGTAQFGVGAELTATRAPAVARGHVAGWVGVGGVGLGPQRTSEWLQVGIDATTVAGPALYYELALPNRAARYVLLEGHVAVGRTFDVAVRETPSHPNAWRVWVNGEAVTRPIVLPGSHGAWRSVATAESWNGGGAGTCNVYGFRFAQVRVVTSPGGAWEPLTGGRVLADPGYRLLRRHGALLAAGGV